MKNLITDLDDEYTSLAAEEKGAAEITGFMDTGCYMLNALLSGSIFGGVPNNRITAFAGEEATGKTFFALSVVKNFLDNDEEAVVVYYDTEASISAKMMKDRGIDVNRVILAEPTTIQNFKHHALKLLKAYESRKERPPMLMILDSLGMLSTTKEIEDSEKGSETKDMTRAQVIRGTFRVLTLKLARVKVPMILTNHTYDAVGSYFPKKEMSGGGGLKYAASSIAFLAKKKEKDGTDVIGNIIRVTMNKTRIAKENKSAELLLRYDTGLDRYYGLLPLAEKYGIISKSGRQYILPDGSKVFGKTINDAPESVFTEEILDKLDEAAHREFKYGNQSELGSTETVPELEEEEYSET